MFECVAPDPDESTLYCNMLRERYYRKEFSNFEDFLAEKAEIQEMYRVKFVYLSKPKDFSLPASEHLLKIGAKSLVEKRSMWELNAGTIFALEFCGCPFFQLCDPLKFGCEFGRQLKPSMVTVQTEEEVMQEAADENEVVLTSKGRKRKMEAKPPRRIKKVGCSAMIFARKILRFSGISPLSRSKRHRTEATTILKEIICEWAAANEPISELLERSGGEIIYVGYFPREEAHDQKHALGEENNDRESVHPAILSFIKSLAVEHGKFSSELYDSVRYFVEQNFPDANLEENKKRRKYWPTDRTVKAIVYQTALKKGYYIRNPDDHELSIHGDSDLEDTGDRHEITIHDESESMTIHGDTESDQAYMSEVRVVKTSEDELMDTRKYVGQVLDLDAAKERLRTVVKNIESLSDVGIMEAAAEALESIYEARAEYVKDDSFLGPSVGSGTVTETKHSASFDYVECGNPRSAYKKVRIISARPSSDGSNMVQENIRYPVEANYKGEEVVFYVDENSLTASDVGHEVSISS